MPTSAAAPTNTLYYGDNLGVLREHLKDESVDLIYLDPPFNSKRDYNLLFKSPKGQPSEAQIEAFKDSWHWGETAEREFDEVLHQPNTNVSQMMRAFRAFLGVNDMIDLAARDKYQFQWWAVSLVDAQPYQGKKKGADGGIDGIKFFYDVTDSEARKLVISVKSDALKADDVRALMAVREREKADIALLISLTEPTAKMKADAASAGFFEWNQGQKKSARIQLLTIDGLLSGAQRAEHPDYVPNVNFKKARKEKQKDGKSLLDEVE